MDLRKVDEVHYAYDQSELLTLSEATGSRLRPGKIFIDIDSLIEGKDVVVTLSGAEVELDRYKVRKYLEKLAKELSKGGPGEFDSYASMKEWILENMEASNGNMFVWVYDKDTAPEVSKGYGPFPNLDDAEAFVIHDLGYFSSVLYSLGEYGSWFAEVLEFVNPPRKKCYWQRLSYFKDGEAKRVDDMLRTRF